MELDPITAVGILLFVFCLGYNWGNRTRKRNLFSKELELQQQRNERVEAWSKHFKVSRNNRPNRVTYL